MNSLSQIKQSFRELEQSVQNFQKRLEIMNINREEKEHFDRVQREVKKMADRIFTKEVDFVWKFFAHTADHLPK